MDRDLPRITSGFYPVERQGDQTFAWTSSRAVLSLRGLDRTIPWQCAVRLRGARPALNSQPVVDLGVDEVRSASYQATNDYQDVAVTVPERPGDPGLTLTIASSPVFVPGGSDKRQLGVQVDRLICTPGARRVLPPRRAMLAAAVSGAVFGATFGLVGGSLLWAIGGTLLSPSHKPYRSRLDQRLRVYQETIAWLAL
jgi:hypothetical protein